MGSGKANDKAVRAAPPPATGAALCAYARGELDLAHAALGDADLHEGVHHARKAIRRARAVLAMGDGLLGPGAGMIDRELRALNDGLSTLRDAHALVEVIDRLLKRERRDDMREVLQLARDAAIVSRTQVADAAMRSDPGLGSRRAMLDVLRAALPALDWARPTPAGLRMAVADSDLRSHEARLRVCDTGEDEDWHRWRRRIRRAAHQRRALAAVGLRVPDDSERFDSRTTHRLGAAQDLSLLLDHCRRDSPFSKDVKTALRDRARPALQRARRAIARHVAERRDACPTD
ncbi:CHAD domain-containing protein [Lysobacter auxotrophicus]|uniref:CHAD domain-containing protein n=1 Tax=Lysobacter auxotrophicus TaxID=2992573 RepID=A0ABM8D8U6_9GAMM|nr:CHAD domain-containing protein [Lysobacter auxotrophicus]BDU14975.1 CHAD domain-containing protein [Lysobacter auxotrophicus]